MKAIAFSIALCFRASIALAGMACPGVDIYYVGAPDWLNTTDLLDGLQSQQTWVGINTLPHPDGLQITRVAPHSPADRAGLLEGDTLLTIEGKDDLSFDDIPVGQTVALTVQRYGQTLPLALVMERGDPVHYALASALERDLNGCPDVKLNRASPVLRAIVLKNALSSDRVFRCDDAHRVLEFMGDQRAIHEAYLVRGSRRLLLTVPHFGTACIPASDLDGNKLTTDAARAFLMRAASDLFRYQEANP